MTGRPVLDLRLGDVLRLRRPHACGGSEWQVDRLGADIGLSCRSCRRHVLLERARVERRLDRFVSRGSPTETSPAAAAEPSPAAAAEPPTARGAEPATARGTEPRVRRSIAPPDRSGAP